MPDVLDKLRSPADLKPLGVSDLTRLAAEVRELIIDTVSKTGGHLASNLGAVELTIALLKVFDPATDRIVWDVSHQAYTYKILTGRRERFATLRQHGGISGFLSRAEHPMDVYGTGHSGTALSAALGMAAARDWRGGQEHVIAVVGDGSLGCGISFEALNNVAATTKRLIVVLNDNEMSISANVGSLARHLGSLLTSVRYNRLKKSAERLVGGRIKTPFLRRLYYRIEASLKSFFLHSVVFEEFGLRYVGPIDGHDLPTLLSALEIARTSAQPILLHVATVKGKGYARAEQQPEKWHGTGAFDVDTGEALSAAGLPTYSEVLGQTLERLAARDERVVAITAAMRAGTGLKGFAESQPRRFFDVGISEEHAVVFAAGLATRGLRPFVAIYSTFSQRAVDCVIHDLCLQKLPVVLCLDRAGIVGDDGPTHHGVFDIALFRSIPNLIMMQPGDEAEFAQMLAAALGWDGPVIIRYPRGCGPGVPVPAEPTGLPLGQAAVVRPGEAVQIWALGDMLPVGAHACDLLAQRGVRAGLVNPRFIRPLDDALLAEQGRTARLFVTIENGVLAGGFGSAVKEQLAAREFPSRVLRFGWPDRFIPHGNRDLLMQQHGLTAEAVAAAVVRGLGGGGGKWATAEAATTAK